MRLIVSEKPSVGMSLAKVLDAKKRQDGYMEGADWLVSWCIGHLVEPAPADAYDPRYSKWRYDDLPIIPQTWQYQVLPDTKKQFDILSALMNRPDVESIVCATDSGREGELIFRLVYNQCGCKKPVRRLWISSMETGAIQRGLNNLLDSANYDNLYRAALCRSKADWLIGINGTRLFSTVYNGRKLNVGRVVTPALALLTEREQAITGFKQEKFYTVELDLKLFHVSGGRFASRTEAGKVRKACIGAAAVVQAVETREKRKSPPLLYDLTALQRDANRLFDYTAQETLDYLQLLYEKKLATYPRTDSRYLTSDMAEKVPGLCEMAAGLIALDLPYSVNANQVIDDAKVSDHHALLPVLERGNIDLSALPTGERKVLNLIAARLLCAVGDPCIYDETTAVLECGGETFSVRGTTEKSPGWRAIERVFPGSLKQKNKPDSDMEEPGAALPVLTQNQQLEVVDTALKSGVTKHPPRFTEGTLLTAMERAGSEDMPEDAERQGIGTPATRAGIIEKLVKSGFVERQKKLLVPTQRGMELIRVMPDQLKSAKLTADWETRLKEVERGQLAPEAFLESVETMLAELVKSYAGVRAASSALSQSGRPAVGKCPRCGRNVVEGSKSFFCEGWRDTPPCGFALWKNDRFFTSKRKELTKKIAAELLKHGRVRMTGLFSEKKGVLYDATVVLNDDGGKSVRYKLEFDNKR